jgi:hypothetical protein
MKPEQYFHLGWRSKVAHTVCIGPSPKDTSRWAIFLDETLIDDNFAEPADAAFYANRHDFRSDNARRLFSGIWVPPELHQWLTARPEPPFIFPNQNN